MPGEALAGGHKMAFQQVHSLARLLTQALAFIHGKGVVHGSIQPSNIMVASGVVKVADLGLGRLAHGPSSAANYRAPEGRLDVAGDLYAMAAVLYMGLSIVLGVGFMAGTFVLTDTMTKAFNDLVDTGYAPIDVLVRSSNAFTAQTSSLEERDPMPGSVLEDVAAVPGVARANGDVLGYAQIVDPATGTVTAELAFVGAATAPIGMIGKVTFAVNKRQGIQVPEQSIVYRGKETLIRTVEDGKAKLTPVVVAETRRGLTEIASGLKSGALVVVRSSGFVADGQAVVVQEGEVAAK